MSRIFEHRHLWQMTRDVYQVATRLLAIAAIERIGALPTVIGVAGGGRAPAYAIGAEIGAAVIVINARHNTSNQIGLPATGHVSCDLGALRRGRSLPGPFLVVDDICGSGATLATVVSALRSQPGPNPLIEPSSTICTATLCRNSGAEPGLPDLYIWDVADWVVFPWERLPSGRTPSPLPVPLEARSC